MKKRKKVKCADGMINDQSQTQPQGDPSQQQGQQGSQQGISIDVQATLNMNGQQQPLQAMSIASPEDLKKFVQYILQVFQQAQGSKGGEQGGDPGAGGPPAQ